MAPKKGRPASRSSSKKDENNAKDHSVPGEHGAASESVKNVNIPSLSDGKTIVCQYYQSRFDAQREGKAKAILPVALVFTHGAGGGLENPATVNFAEGFAHGYENPTQGTSVLCFQGTMNLASRTKFFHTIIDHFKQECALGGRSMGSRAAVITANENKKTKTLVLVSYPLTAPSGDKRDKILYDVAKDVRVLFVIGDRDSMCDLKELREVMKKMKAKTWLVVVKGADHGMSISGKRGKEVTGEIRQRTGAVAAKWLHDIDPEWEECVVKPGDIGKTSKRAVEGEEGPLERAFKKQKKST